MPDFGLQPTHTFIEGAHHFTPDRARALGDAALRALEDHAPDPRALAALLGLDASAETSERMHAHVLDRLAREPVQDFRLDFEDGYGFRPDEVEDAHAIEAARAAARGAREGTLPPFLGIRVKPFSPPLRARSERTTELFVREFVEAADGLPVHLAVNLAKVTSSAQVSAMAEGLAALEHLLGLPEHSIALEVMLETPRAFLGEDGRSPLPSFRDAGGARLRSACFGPYDFTTAIGIAPHEQRLGHPSCDHARQQMLMAYGGSTPWIADGSTGILPVGGREDVHAGWAAHFDDVSSSLLQGFYQGWDVHAAQLVTRWAAAYLFFATGYSSAAPRLRALLDRAAESTRLGAMFDDPATGEALLRFVRRAMDGGFVAPGQLADAGLEPDELHGASFNEIIRGRVNEHAGRDE